MLKDPNFYLGIVYIFANLSNKSFNYDFQSIDWLQLFEYLDNLILTLNNIELTKVFNKFSYYFLENV